MVWEWEWFTGLHMQGETDPELRNWVTRRRKEEKSLQRDSSDESYVWKLVWAEGSGLGWMGGLVGWLDGGRGVRVVLVVGSLVGEPKPGRLGVEREAHALSRVTEPPLAGLSSTAKRAKRWEIGRVRYSVCWVIASVEVVLEKNLANFLSIKVRYTSNPLVSWLKPSAIRVHVLHDLP